MNLNCTIKNINNGLYPDLSIKKYRQIVFINKQELVIYTALVIGAGGNQSMNEPKTGDRLAVQVSFDLSDETLKTQEIQFENKQDEFLSEISMIKHVWGDKCEELSTQQDIKDKLIEISQEDNFNVNNNRIDVEHKYLYIPQEKKEGNGIVACGSKVDISNKQKYYTVAPQSDLNRMVDIFSWVKTTIVLSEKISPKEELEFRLTFPQNAAKETSELLYMSFYLCPMEGYHLLDNSKVKYELLNGQENDDVLNNLTKATQNNDLYYKEWKDDYNIENRHVYRLNHEKLFKNLEKPICGCRGININCRLNPDTEKGSIQFVMGAILSAAITYGVDSGRITEVKNYYITILPADIEWYIVCMILFFAFIRWSSRKDKIHEGWKDRITGACGIAGLSTLGLWFIGAYVLGRKPGLTLPAFYAKVLQGMLLGGTIAVILYVVMTLTLVREHYYKHPFSREVFF